MLRRSLSRQPVLGCENAGSAIAEPLACGKALHGRYGKRLKQVPRSQARQLIELTDPHFRLCPRETCARLLGLLDVGGLQHHAVRSNLRMIHCQQAPRGPKRKSFPVGSSMPLCLRAEGLPFESPSPQTPSRWPQSVGTRPAPSCLRSGSQTPPTSEIVWSKRLFLANTSDDRGT